MRRFGADIRNGNDQRDTGDGILSGFISASAEYRVKHRWSTRVTWNRMVTRYSRNNDVILSGIEVSVLGRSTR
jgi:hypothetical protein